MIIEADGIFYQVTQHAEAQMMMRDIYEFEIIDAIENGEIEFTDDGNEFYRWEVGNREIGVVIAEERIITVMEIV